MKKLASSGDEDLIERLSRLCLPYDSREPGESPGDSADPSGSAERPVNPYWLAWRTERLLRITSTERGNHIARLAAKNDPRASHGDTIEFTKDDITATINEWRQRPETWMNPKSLQWINRLSKRQRRGREIHKRFHTMLHQIYGNKPLVDLCLRYPICSAEQPAELLSRFADEWEKTLATRHTNRSTPTDTPRLSNQIYWLTKRQERGRWIANWIKDNWNNWYELTEEDRKIWDEYDKGNIASQIDELRSQQQPRFPGVAQSMYDASCRTSWVF
jgi:hypothetical protein